MTAMVERRERFTYGLIHDVFEVLERHGYRLPDDADESDRARGAAVEALLRVTRAYEGGDLP